MFFRSIERASFAVRFWASLRPVQVCLNVCWGTNPDGYGYAYAVSVGRWVRLTGTFYASLHTPRGSRVVRRRATV